MGKTNNMICDICGKEFTSTLANLRKHRRYKHNIIENVVYNVKCMELLCNFSCSKLETLRHHLETAHNISQEVDELLFDNIEDFNKWKAAEESRCVAIWVKRHGNGKQKEPTIYYYCNRSGKKRLLAADQRKRKIKKQGSCKIDFACTSAIIVKIAPGGIRIKYYKSHYGHDNEIDYIPLSEEAKSMVASLLVQGVTPAEILNRIKDSTDPDVERLRLISKKDIYNIIRDYNLIDLEKEKITNKISRIMKNHRAAETAKNMFIIKFDSGWKVLCENESNWVKINSLKENHICKLKCSACASCVHLYSCTCLDFVMHNNMCIHIHKVCIKEDGEKILYDLEKASAEEQLIATRDRIKKDINSIFIMSNCSNIADRDTLNKINRHLKSALNLIGRSKSLSTADEGTIQYENIEGQLSFPSANIIILPAPHLAQPSRCVKDEATKILQKYRPIVPRVEKRLQEVQGHGNGEASKVLQNHKPIIHRLEEVRASELGVYEPPKSNVRRFRPIILTRTPKKAK